MILEQATLNEIADIAVRYDAARTETNNTLLALDIARQDHEKALEVEQRLKDQLVLSITRCNAPSPFAGIKEAAQQVLAGKPEPPGMLNCGAVELRGKHISFCAMRLGHAEPHFQKETVRLYDGQLPGVMHARDGPHAPELSDLNTLPDIY